MSLARSLRILPLLAAPALVAAMPAYAQDSSADNSATVETLFGAGKALVAQGKFAEACPKFLASYNLEHRIGTLLNLADCYEKNQQLASAWARYIEASTLAQRASQGERAAFATTHAKALEPTLSKLTISVPGATPGAAPVAGLVVRRDGVAVDPGAYGVAVAVDGGTHTIEASAPGKKSWSSQVVVASVSDAKTVGVPALEDGPPPLEAVQPGAAPDAPDAHKNGGGTRIAGFVVGGVGIAGLAAGDRLRRDGELEGERGQARVRARHELPGEHESGGRQRHGVRRHTRRRVDGDLHRRRRARRDRSRPLSWWDDPRRRPPRCRWRRRSWRMAVEWAFREHGDALGHSKECGSSSRAAPRDSPGR